jgi:hypothetical protein
MTLITELNMGPCTPAAYAGNAALGNPELRSEFALPVGGCPDLAHVVGGKFCGASSLAVGVTPFCDSISAVVQNSTDEKMSRVYAASVIARVADQFAGNVESGGFCRAAMRVFVAYSAVARACFAGLPLPTVVRSAFANVRPKGLFACLVSNETGHRAVFPPTVCIRFPNLELHTASNALQFHGVRTR